MVATMCDAMEPVLLYLVSDGKPGHLAQSRGLAEAIGRVTRAKSLVIEPESKMVAPQPYKDAGLILAAGRDTHSHALRLRKYLGVPAVVLMNPGWLGRQRFDLSIIPKHDGVKASSQIIVTEGVLNPITPSTDADPSAGLILVGGPSKHHDWDDASIERQFIAILDRSPTMRWTATGSRRTPAGTDALLAKLAETRGDRLVYTPASQTPEGWVAEQLARCGVCWVSEDSVSMVYEALTSGAQVGLLDVPRKGSLGRVVRGVVSLVERGWVTPFEAWQGGASLSNEHPPLAEADRVARLIVDRWGGRWA